MNCKVTQKNVHFHRLHTFISAMMWTGMCIQMCIQVQRMMNNIASSKKAISKQTTAHIRFRQQERINVVATFAEELSGSSIMKRSVHL